MQRIKADWFAGAGDFTYLFDGAPDVDPTADLARDAARPRPRRGRSARRREVGPRSCQKGIYSEPEQQSQIQVLFSVHPI